MTGCRFEGVILRKSRLLDARFDDCTFVDFTGSNWADVDMSRSRFDDCVPAAEARPCPPRTPAKAYVVDLTGTRKLDNPEGMASVLDAFHQVPVFAPTHWGIEERDKKP